MGKIINEILSAETLNCWNGSFGNYIIFFWSPSDIRGIRIAQYLSARKNEFEENGLGIIGIVSPETEPEKDLNYFNGILQRFEIDLCCVPDNNLYFWAYFNNQFSPNIIILDKDDNMLEESSGIHNVIPVEKKIIEITGKKDSVSLLDCFKSYHIDMRFILEPGNANNKGEINENIPVSLNVSATLSGNWLIHSDGYPVSGNGCVLSIIGHFRRFYIAMDSENRSEINYDSNGLNRNCAVDDFNLVELNMEHNNDYKNINVKIGEGIKIYSIQVE